jgi:hypothetical protein
MTLARLGMAIPYHECVTCQSLLHPRLELLPLPESQVIKYPQDNIVCYHIPARDNFPACKCYVDDHQDLRPDVMSELEKMYKVRWGEDTLFVGTKGSGL